ncbi:hypothetical protein DFA_00680 [Cavenderia fasciculata]|uniref:Transmembrane protein n=1 Tax=Cavenderia fasciculata TaxID=261658 RepID=F4PT79_CACFS|nr:uncharacterized protein DFA_00680 [Cavenderia fasciculata]EGG20815.1 hypothetical protein DFA_00680 [Cavenderia fasciculata]|eukprot:XP_004358665.1 hypothetical protein DFA_00680 [Cavenderia fasciculata]
MVSSIVKITFLLAVMTAVVYGKINVCFHCDGANIVEQCTGDRKCLEFDGPSTCFNFTNACSTGVTIGSGQISITNNTYTFRTYSASLNCSGNFTDASTTCGTCSPGVNRGIYAECVSSAASIAASMVFAIVVALFAALV